MGKINSENIDEPALHIRCGCGITYFHFDENNCLACDCDFYAEYQRRRGIVDDEEFEDLQEN